MAVNSNSFSLGWKIIWFSLAATLVIWITTLSDYRFIRNDPFLFLSKMAALVGTVGMCWTFLFSTRLQLLEVMFSGLDKVYHAHRLLAILSFSLICSHPLFQILRFIPNWQKGILFFLHEWVAIGWGILALVLFITLISLTLWIKIPYHIWKRTHEFFIFVLLLAFIHTVWIDKQVNDSLLLSIWLYGFMTLACICYIYIRFFYWRVGPRYPYSIRSIEKRGKIWNIQLKPLEKEMHYQPAQFIYITFDNPKVSKEPHPFSVSSSPDHDFLRISIKNLGDYTSRLDALQPGDKATIWGPYGRFYEKFLFETKKDAVLISGGIGITPFLSLLHFEADHLNKRKTIVFYCVKNRSRAYFHEEIEALAQRDPSIVYFPWYSDSQGFMNIEDVKKKIGENLKGKIYFLCGPLSMMNLFTDQLTQNGVKNQNIVFEDFNLLD